MYRKFGTNQLETDRILQKVYEGSDAARHYCASPPSQRSPKDRSGRPLARDL